MDESTYIDIDKEWRITILVSVRRERERERARNIISLTEYSSLVKL